MIRKPSRSALAAISLLCVVVLAACSTGAPFVRDVAVAPTSASIDAQIIGSGNTQQFTATAFYTDGTQKDVTSTAQWASSNSGVAAIDATGLATAGNPPDTTTVTITGSIGGHAATGTLTVVHSIQSIAVTPLAASVPLGLTQQYKATGTYANLAGGTHPEDVTKIATWASDTQTVATIDGNGLAATLGKTTGTANITASITKTGGATTITSAPAAVLTVTAAVPASLQVTAGSGTIAVGTSTTLTAVQVDTNQQASTTAPASPVTWAIAVPADCSPAGAVLLAPTTVNGTEAVNGQIAGSCKVTATEAGVLDPTGKALTGNATVTVAVGSTHFAFVANTADKDIGGFAVTASSATPLVPLTAPTTPAPSDIQQAVLNTNGKYLYSIDSASFVHVFTVSSTGVLALPKEPSTLPSVGATSANYGIVDPTGRFFFATDHEQNAVHSAPISTTDGTLGTVSTVTGVGAVAGSGPEFIAIDRQGKFAFVVADDNMLYAFSINQTSGTLTLLTTYPTGVGPLAVTVDPSNKFVYTADFGDNTISVFTLNSTTGALTAGTTKTITGATALGNVLVDPSSKYLYVMDIGDVSANPQVAGSITGYNLGTDGSVGAATGSPVATGMDPFGMALDPTGTLIAVDNNFSGTISLFKVTAGVPAAETPATIGTGSGASSAPLWVTFLNAP